MGRTVYVLDEPVAHTTSHVVSLDFGFNEDMSHFKEFMRQIVRIVNIALHEAKKGSPVDVGEELVFVPGTRLWKVCLIKMRRKVAGSASPLMSPLALSNNC